ncbi:hypothetical protein UlMin_040207 [Ulmus minor]
MDPNQQHLLLSYVLSQLNPNSHPPLSPQLQQSLLAQFPNLDHPKVVAQLTQVFPSEVAQTLSLFRTLGPRADQSAVAVARAKIVEIESELRKGLEEAQSREAREAAEKELEIYKAVLRLEDMREACEKQLREEEERLVEVYRSLMADLDAGGDGVNEEVIRVLKEAESEVVERVELPGRQLKIVPEAFGRLHGLVSLNLSQNLLQFIPDSIAGLQKLEEFDVSSNLLVSLPDSIGLLLNLRVLNVSGNKLNALPETIAGCSSLVELDASFNNLMCLPTNIAYGLLNLEKLSIQLNKIRLLPSSICEMRSLRYMDVHFNELHGLPYTIGRLTNLEFLNLSSNFSDLRELPDSIGDLINLTELDLSNNQIRVLPDTFGRLTNLTKLNLDQNPLVIPPMEIANRGVEAVKEFMAKRWFDPVDQEQQRSVQETSQLQAQPGWLTWGTSLLNNVVSGVSRSVTEYLGAGKAP